MDSITTLIVEDEPMLAEILVDNIKQFPQFDVIGIADKLESARKQLRLYQPQLILLDNFLPDGKGIDLIRHAVSTHYKGRIIFITADNHMETISEALRLGGFDYLIKPVHYQRLQHTLERFARYRSSLRSSEQASQLHVDALFNIQAREQTEPASAPLRGIDESHLSARAPAVCRPDGGAYRRLAGPYPRQQQNHRSPLSGTRSEERLSGSGNQLRQGWPT